MELTREEFDKLVADEAKINWKVKQLLETHGGYDNLPDNIKTLLHNRIGVTRTDSATFSKGD